MKFSTVDKLNVVYLAMVSGLVIGFHGRVNHWLQIPLLFAAYVVVIVTLAWIGSRWPRNPLLTMLRLVYPLMALPWVYGAIGDYVLVLHGHFLDDRMKAWEHGLFGVYPNVYLEHFVSRSLTELMMACYFSYYFYVIVPPLTLMAQRRYVDLERYVFSVLVAFYACYLGFVMLPLVGPIVSLKGAFAQPELNGYVITPVQSYIMAHGDPPGTCFPSSHVAVAWTGLLCIRQCFGKRIFRVILPSTAMLTVAVVYNRYHYISDSLAGLATAGVCYGFCVWFFKRVGAPSRSAATQPVREDSGALTTA